MDTIYFLSLIFNPRWLKHLSGWLNINRWYSSERGSGGERRRGCRSWQQWWLRQSESHQDVMSITQQPAFVCDKDVGHTQTSYNTWIGCHFFIWWMLLSLDNIIAACIKVAHDNCQRLYHILMAYGNNIWVTGSCLTYDRTSHGALGAAFSRLLRMCTFLHLLPAELSDIHAAKFNKYDRRLLPEPILQKWHIDVIIFWFIKMWFQQSSSWGLNMENSCGEGSMLLSEKCDKLVSFELNIPHEISFNFHHCGTFRQETPKSLPKLSMQANNSF